MASLSAPRASSSLLLLLLLFLACPSQSATTNGSSATAPPVDTSTNATAGPKGCGRGLDPVYRFLCDRRAAWGIVLETLASAGFLFSLGLLLGLLLWSLWVCASVHSRRSGVGGAVACTSMFLLATAGLFGLTFAFVVQLTPRTCPARVFLFSVLFALAFACLLARCLALLGFAAARGWGEPALALGLSLVQAVISAQWLLVVLVRDGRPCEYSQGEFAMLQIYVLCLLGVSLAVAARFLCRSCATYGYGAAGPSHLQARVQAAALFLTLLLSAGVWAAWIAMLTRGNPELGRRPRWDDPALGVALVSNGWVLLMGHGLFQVSFLCRGEAKAQDLPLSFAGWTSTSADIPELRSPKEGRENGSFETDADKKKGRRTEPSLRSPYESGFSMTEIDPDKDYTIPRPHTDYDDFYTEE